MSPRVAFVLLLVGSSGGCGVTPAPDAATPPPGDGAPALDAELLPGCVGAPPMALGACVDLVGGGQCVGGADEVPIFDAMSEGDPLRVVVGPQGASMFAISLRVTGVDGGDPAAPVSADDPRVEILVRDEEGTTVAQYRGLHALDPDPDLPGWLVKAGLFVVVDVRPTSLDGRVLTAEATLVDRDGVERCGRLSFRATT